jgi:hypothetical protein
MIYFEIHILINACTLVLASIKIRVLGADVQWPMAGMMGEFIGHGQGEVSPPLSHACEPPASDRRMGNVR